MPCLSCNVTPDALKVYKKTTNKWLQPKFTVLSNCIVLQNVLFSSVGLGEIPDLPHVYIAPHNPPLPFPLSTQVSF